MNSPACQRARTKIYSARVILDAKYLPRESPEYFLPISVIQKTINFDTVEGIFYCTCDSCRRLSGTLHREDDRIFNGPELSGAYSTVFALLLLLSYAGLMHEFLRHRVKLDRALTENDLSFLFGLPDRLSFEESRNLQQQILKKQYRFRVQKIEARFGDTVLDSKEALPIREDAARAGKGDFGEVYGFEIHDDYVGLGFEKVCSCISFAAPRPPVLRNFI